MPMLEIYDHSSNTALGGGNERSETVQEWLQSNKGNRSLLCTLSELSSYHWNDDSDEEQFSLRHVQRWMDENERNGDFLREAANYKDACKFTPLHWLVQARPPPDVVQRLLQIAPETVRAPCNFGALPLHYACQKDASADVVQLLIRAYPTSVEECNNVGGLPIHYACENKASSPDVFRVLLEAYPKGAEIQSKFLGLPLHIACRKGASPNVIRILLQAYPRAAQMLSVHGVMPLHYACENNNTSLEVIQVLLDANPEAAKVTSSLGSLPLHLACKNSSSLEVLDLLLQAYPHSIHVKNRQGDLPSSILHHQNAKKLFGVVPCMFLLHEAVLRGLSTHLITLLLQAFPESCTMQDTHGMTPLHYSCMKSTAELSIHTVMLLIDGNPESCSIVNQEGKTPLQLLKQTLSTPDDNGRLFLHHWASSSSSFQEGIASSTKSLRFLVEVYSEGIFLPDNHGMLPFHHACLNTTSSLDILMLFLHIHPESILSNY